MKRDVRSAIDLIAAVLLGLLTLAVVIAEIAYSGLATTKQETALYSALELLLGMAFSLFLARIVTKREFEESLKRFGFSAYRRARDIERIVGRIMSETARMRRSYASDKAHELDLIGTMATDIADTVQSSIADWAEVIGEELRKEKELSVLRKQEQELQQESRGKTDQVQTEDSETQKELEALREQISLLEAQIPSPLVYGDAKPLHAYEIPSSLADMFYSRLTSRGELVLDVAPFADVTPSELGTLPPGEPLLLRPGKAMHSFDFEVFRPTSNSEGESGEQYLGSVVKPKGILGFDQIEYNLALEAVLDSALARQGVTRGVSEDAFEVEYVGLSPERWNFFQIRYPRRNKPQ